MPILYYPDALKELLEETDRHQNLLVFFNDNGYSNGWINGIFNYHYFHSNTYEVLGCIAGRSTVQLGGPGKDEYAFNKGDVILIPAGVAHKLTGSTDDFKIVGAYPNGMELDTQRGNALDYDAIKNRSYDTLVPATDPVTKFRGPVREYWDL